LTFVAADFLDVETPPWQRAQQLSFGDAVIEPVHILPAQQHGPLAILEACDIRIRPDRGTA
jgi:hypothetical protein